MTSKSDIPTPPPWFRPGCLPRKSKPGEVCPFLKDRIKVIPEEEWPALIGKISLRVHVNAVLDQNGIGSCAAEASTQGGLHIPRDQAGLGFILLNPLFPYHHTCYGRDNGSAIDDNLRFIRGDHPDFPGKGGVAPESVWPRSRGWRAKPSGEAYAEAWRYRADEFFDITGKAEFGTALLCGFAVVFGYPGHAIAAVALKDRNTIIYANSWGAGWNNGGYGEIGFRSIEWDYGAFAIRSSIVPSDHGVIPPPRT